MPSLSPQERHSLLQSALDARSLSYSPYSKFRVGAAVLLTDGSIVQGANVENASYGAGVCAERTAILTASATRFTRSPTQPASASHSPSSYPLTGAIRAIAVSSDLPNDPCSPCGICRQFIREFAPLDTPILMVWAKWQGGSAGEVKEESKRGQGCYDEEGVIVRTLEELLPLSFGPDELNKM
ncbi:cytidine deaminase [Microstroma glucosiphilum]|uniref:Cytidine deaminase n=1 Tax=Pseudomicrostroma glucosiphilum TaxID=1684307 RepID=A0A316UJD1_9BASI|nr:cytidine deaminase [Pseudomicrostroma glucosiphilum]PWN24053.1 cytidine deaminase [Pseudomicrostroma glucosiphilum]